MLKDDFLSPIRRKVKRFNKGNTTEFDVEFVPQAIEIIQSWNISKPISMGFYTKYHPMAWGIACGTKGVYQIITEELVDFINHLIKDKKAIEVCSGVGTLGRALSIPMIDRKLHLDKRTDLYYKAHHNELNQLPNYPDDIIELTANKAYRIYEPDWVVACWVTQKRLTGSKVGMAYGPIEEEFLKKSSYIHLGSGHLDIHQLKRINKFPHTIVEADWIVDRTGYKSTSQMRIWSKEEIDFDAFPEHLEFDYII